MPIPTVTWDVFFLFTMICSDAASFSLEPRSSTCALRGDFPSRLGRPTLSRTYTQLRADLTTFGSDMQVLECVGSGSYGTVHRIASNSDSDQQYIGKRAWTVDDLTQADTNLTKEQCQAKAKRCENYWKVENHCFCKLDGVEGIPKLVGCSDIGDYRWMVFELLQSADGSVAPSLQDIMKHDHQEQRSSDEHHLSLLSKALQVSEGESKLASLVETLDTVMEQVLTILTDTHAQRIVHRDIKPGNLLEASGKIILIDFGSAADMGTAGPLRKNIGLSDTVAISPVYAAPELFVELGNAPENFDCFSVALLYCQLLFQYLDERTDAGFHQQLKNAGWDLDNWLRTELQAKVRPVGLEDAFDVLVERPGLWALLKSMLQPDPILRSSSSKALSRFQSIRSGAGSRDADGPFLTEVLESTDFCLVDPFIVRPLHFVATFNRAEPLGLVLAEPDSDMEEEEFEGDALDRWTEVKESAVPGEVYVQGLIPGGQADKMSIFETGDRLQGVGELPIAQSGFQRTVEMIQDQPRGSKFVTLHFDRKALSSTEAQMSLNEAPVPALEGPLIIKDQGAWSSQGRRSAQEDAFVLNEVYATTEQSILLAGVFDGHLGTNASSFIQQEFPINFSEELFRGPNPGNNLERQVDPSNARSEASLSLKSAWETTCQSYRAGCSQSADECVAEYDAREGILKANTASESTVAGSTAVIAALDKNSGYMSFLNCGDSRAVVCDSEAGKAIFVTEDHKPETEVERFSEGQKLGKDYSLPQCRLSRWFVSVGEYEYAVSRSLEGPFATDKGIVSDADVTEIHVSTLGVSRVTVLLASDGLWEVIDTAEACKIIQRLRETMSAGDAAKTLCSMALERGSSDNVSAVVVSLD